MNELPTIVASNYASTNYEPSAFHLTTDPPWAAQFFTEDKNEQLTEEEINISTRRIVQVFIADPNENIPLDKSLLYQDEKPHLTDLNDQELFFELDIKAILEKHNAVRITLSDKEATKKAGKDILLEAAKVRDLKMTVVTVAQF